MANPVPWPKTPNLEEKPTLTIKTPQNYSSYGVGNVALDFSVVKPDSWLINYDWFFNLGQIASIDVSLDGKSCNSADYSQALKQLALGMHQLNITVLSYAYYMEPIPGIENIPGRFVPYQYPIVVSDIVYFTLEPPKIQIHSPQATTYDKSSVSLIYSINQSAPQLYYVLDGQNTTETGKTTFNYIAQDELNATLYATILTGLSNGYHKVTVYATDEVGNLGSQTVEFTVENSNSTDSNVLLYGLVFAIIPVAAVCLIVGLRTYQRKKG
ncbi:MAG: hypothetical protein NWE92_13620 [Candidatus Bathyarchaeota archaeon]|nr:hypothetical protein [Candidatus Bathyarchaeota archaeon]